MADAVLEVQSLNVRFTTAEGPVHAVRDLAFHVHTGETLGIVGESGSGKSQTALAIMGLLAANGRADGSARFRGDELIGLSASAMNQVRGAGISMVFQDPMTSLNPYLTIGNQMRQVLQRHLGLSRRKAHDQARAMFEMVRIPEAEHQLNMHPHELSGGMRQRVMMAMALSCRPGLLIADEPTTALDVTVQAQILALMQELKAEVNTSILLITHDMGVVAGNTDRVLVMRDGECREYDSVDNIFYRPTNKCTRELLAAVPRLDDTILERLPAGDAAANKTGTAVAASEQRRPDCAKRALLTVDRLGVRFRVAQPGLLAPARPLVAVDDVSFKLAVGETLGVVGESGCGKSSLARAVLQLIPEASGRVCFLGRDLAQLEGTELRNMRRDMQVIFQDPQASLDPRMTIAQIVGESLDTFHSDLNQAERNDCVVSALLRVGLGAEHLNRYPHEFSGGQAQRIGIARALVFGPKLIVCDEPVSALDVSIQGQIINLLMGLQAERGLALIFIAHDLAVVRHISHRVMVMYLGRAVEIADRQSLYEHPRHPYTRALINAVPIPDPEIERSRRHQVLLGDLPSPLEPPSGCGFRTRCPYAIQRCRSQRPPLRHVGQSLVACHRADEIE